MRNLLNIYNAFNYNNSLNDKESLNDIVKSTKSVLANKLKFSEYINSYSKTTEKYTFKSPGITDYPIFKKKSCVLIPVKTRKINYYEDLKITNNKRLEKSASNPKKILIIPPKESLYKSKLINNIKSSKKIFKNKLNNLCLIKNINKKERYNSLFLDFFYKWNNGTQITSNYFETSKTNNTSPRDYINCEKKENQNIWNISNKNYSELKYDDNKIFNHDYSRFINEKIEYIKNNEIENNQKELESTFNDANGKEIKLKLQSIKIIFKEINEKKKLINNFNNLKDKDNNNSLKNNELYIPLYYAFLLCYKNLELFQYILVSSIIFSNDFETITFNEKLINPALNAINNFIINNSNQNAQKKEYKYDSKKSIKSPTSIYLSPKKKEIPFRKLATKNYNSFSNNFAENKSNNFFPKKSISSARGSYLDNILEENNKKREEIIHSNRNRNYNNIYYKLSTDNNRIENEENKNNINNNNNYNEYNFLWETPIKTFLVTIQLPIIYFKYKNLKSEIIAFCDRKLFLYLYKKNFINWDYYVLNFLFSIKAFRKIILNNYSINKKFFYKDILSKINNNEKLNKTNKILSFRNIEKNIKSNTEKTNNYLNDNKKLNILNDSIIINKTKTYNILNENNESYLFFYTDKLYNNSIIKFYSYLIEIDYEKLNPKLKWKYYLDFKQMKLLNEISKYESLDSFLPKIIKTDFQNGFLSMDFSLFTEFDIEILGYEKKNVINSSTNKSKNKTIGSNNTNNNTIIKNDLCIDIKYPFIKVNKIINNNNNISIVLNKIELDIDFLQKINNYKIDFWSKKILKVLSNDNNLSNNLNLTPQLSGKSVNSKNNKNNNNNNISNNILVSDSKSSFFNRKKYLKSMSFNSINFKNKLH